MRLVIPVPELVDTVVQRIGAGERLGLLTARRVEDERFNLCALVVGDGDWTLLEAPLEAGATSFSSLTGRVPQAH